MQICQGRLWIQMQIEVSNLHRQALTTNMTNPFAVASWLHLVLARCHPFDVCSHSSHGNIAGVLTIFYLQDGNGRMTRLVASIPLLLAGYPPISISLDQRSVYLQAVNEVNLLFSLDVVTYAHSNVGIQRKP